MQQRELELQLADALDRLATLEAEIEIIKNPPPRLWMNPSQVEEYSKGKYLAKKVIEKVRLAIAEPENMPLKLGDDYTIDTDGRGESIRVNYRSFDRSMVMIMRESAFGE